MNTNNTERGWWTEVKIDDDTYRFRTVNEWFECQRLLILPISKTQEWIDETGCNRYWLKRLIGERIAARDRDAALAELVVKVLSHLKGASYSMATANYELDVRQTDKLIEALQGALHTSTEEPT